MNVLFSRTERARQWLGAAVILIFLTGSNVGAASEPRQGNANGQAKAGVSRGAEAPPTFQNHQTIPVVLTGDLNFDSVRDIAIQQGGRKKPLDTFARETGQSITGTMRF